MTDESGTREAPDAITDILDGISDPVLVVGQELRVIVANRAAVEVFGPRLVGQSAFTILRQPEARTALEKGLTQGVRSEARFVIESPGHETVFRLVVHPLTRAVGLNARAVISLDDISHVEEAEQMRRDFVANVSHELRSPLTALSGFIETLKGAARNDSAARERFLTIMEAEALRMNRLIGDLLSLSKVEAAERIRPRESISIGDVLRTTLAALRPLIDDNGIRVEIQTQDIEDASATTRDSLPAPGAGPWVAGDRDQLTQVFHNLLENAVKYGGSGGKITIRINTVSKCGGFAGTAVRVDVIDYGEGIDALHLPRLTERFYRVDSHRSRAMGGTGLGLAIVKHIVNRHRGRLQVESVRGSGSVFSVLLPTSDDAAG